MATGESSDQTRQPRGTRYKWMFWVCLLVLGALVANTVLDATSMGSCRYQITKAKRFEQKSVTIVQYEKLCGLGGGASTSLAVLATKLQLYFPKYLSPFYSVEGRRNLQLEIDQNGSLIVEMPKDAQTFQKLENANGLGINYVGVGQLKQ